MIYISPGEVARLHKDVLLVLMALFSQLEDGNRVGVSVKEMARELEVPRIYVADAIRHLVRVGVLSKGTREGDLRSYLMSPNLVWKGTPEAHELALQRYNRMKAARITGIRSTPRQKKTSEASSSLERAKPQRLQEVTKPT